MEVLTSRIIIHPSDLERTLAFYRFGLGLAVAREFGDGEHRGVVFFAGGGLIEVTGGGPIQPSVSEASTDSAATADPADPAASPSPDSGPMVLWLQVRDLDDTLAELAGRDVPVVRPAVLEPWGLVEAWIDDPDGLRIHLVEVPADHPLRRDARDLAAGADR
jgi:catechol 2,3-dioxygenase-like lactoylglutathione lyase family enzyme